MHVPLYILVGIGFLTWAIFMLSIVKFCRFFDEFVKFKARNDIELNNVVWHLKKAEETREQILAEQKRQGKLLYDLFKGNAPTFYSEVDYKQEDLLRHERKEQADANNQQHTRHNHSPHGSRHKQEAVAGAKT